jgi:hypothetical protein
MDGFPLAARANRAFVEQDYPAAISLYTEALDEDDSNCSLLWWAAHGEISATREVY